VRAADDTAAPAANGLPAPPSRGSMTRAHRPPEIPGRDRRSWLHARPLLRCLAIYRLMPVRFTVCFVLFVAVNVGMALQQHLVGRAVHDLEPARLARHAGQSMSAFTGWGWFWLRALIAVALVRGLLQYAAGILSLQIGQDLLTHLREGILVQVQRLDLAYHVRHGLGEMVTRTTRDADKVRDALISFWRNVVETALVVLGSLALVTWYGRWLALGPLAAVVLGVFWLVRQTPALVKLDRAAGAAFDDVNQDVTEGVHGIRVIKAFSLEGQRIARFEEAVAAYVELARRALRFAAQRIPIPQVIVALGQVWVFVVGALAVGRGELDLGCWVSALLVMNTVIFRVEGVGRVMQVFADARASAARIMELLDAEPGIQDPPRAEALPSGPLGVRLEGVSVRSPGGAAHVLRHCSLTVSPGEVVALVGATGAGKSTLTALLPRLVDPDEGRVSVGSDREGWRDVTRVSLAELRGAVHVVPQDVFLFSDSLAANLRLARPGASDEELRRALSVAAAEDFVAQLPDGWETPLGDRGVTLSGGQRQRLTVARALVGGARLLVLDDATSALDAVTESALFEALREPANHPNSVRPTILVIASKLSTVLLADRAVVLVNGAIAVEGRHEDLVGRVSAYRELLGIDRGLAAA